MLVAAGGDLTPSSMNERPKSKSRVLCYWPHKNSGNLVKGFHMPVTVHVHEPVCVTVLMIIDKTLSLH